MNKVLILKAGNTDSQLKKTKGDFENWIILRSGRPQNDFTILKVNQLNSSLNTDSFKSVIITGSHDMITDEPPYLSSAVSFLHEIRKRRIPVLGICFGHQLLAHAFGGLVAENPAGPEFGAVELELNENAKEDRLFSKLPQKFKVFMSHKQTVARLPVEAKQLAQSRQDPNAVFFLEPAIWGVQFHPEFDAEIMEYYLKHHFKVTRKNLDFYFAPTPFASEIIARFLALTI